MKGYKYLEVSTLRELGRLDLVSTDSQVLDWVLVELPKVFPTCFVKDDYVGEFPSGEKCSCRIDWPKKEKWTAGSGCLWAVKQLCLQGWEPFQVEETRWHGSTYHLRFEVTDNG